MASFYNGNAMTIRGASKHTGQLVFTDSFCEFSSNKYSYREDFDDIGQLEVSVTKVSVPSIFGAKSHEGISVCYRNSNIGDFILESENAISLVNSIMSFVQAERDRVAQEEKSRRDAQNKTEEESKEAEYLMSMRGELQDRLRELKEKLDSFPPEAQNFPKVRELMQEYNRLKREIEGGYSHYESYLKHKEVLEKEEQEKNEKKKAEAKSATARGELDEAYIYLSILMESAAGNPEKDAESFAKRFEEAFPALDEGEIIRLYHHVKANLQDEEKKQHYFELFMQQPLSDRFDYSAGNLFSLTHKGMNELDFDQKAENAIDQTADCFAPFEMDEVSALMNEKLAKLRKQLDNQCGSVEPEWIDYSTAKDYLMIEVAPYNGKNYEKMCEFQKLVDQYVVTVKLATKGIPYLSTVVNNVFHWYWSANVRDIWEEAAGNKVNSSAELNEIKFGAVKAAYEQVCEKWPKGSSEKRRILHEAFVSFGKEVAPWVANRANRSFFSALSIGATTAKEEGENNIQYVMQSLVNDTIYITNNDCKIEARFYGDLNALIVTYIPYLEYGYARLVENDAGTSEDDLDDYFDELVEAMKISKAYHVERDEFQVAFDQLSNAIQGQG